MEYAILCLVALTNMVQNIFKQKYTDRNPGGVCFFSGMTALFAMLFFLAVNRDFDYSRALLLPSFGFAVSYAVATVFAVLAIRCGSLAKTTLILSCSLLLPTFYGIICLKEPVHATMIAGVLLLLVSLVLVHYEKEKSAQKVTFRWVLYVLLAFLGNGMCSIVQKAKQLCLGEAGNNMFMIVALGVVVVLLFAFSMASGTERQAFHGFGWKGWLLALLCGIANGATNYFVIFLNSRLPASVMFPIISAGGMILIFLYSVFVRKEKFSLRQKVGFLLGTASIVLLNL